MKGILLGLIFFSALHLHAQQKLYGITREGGTLNGGTVFSVSPDGSDPYALISFGFHDKSPLPVLLNGHDGYFYGVTSSGGSANQGAIYKVKTDGSEYIKIHDFGTSANTDGLSDGSLYLNSDGYLYGTTSNGGSTFHAGVIYKIKTDGNDYEVIYEFENTPGEPKSATVITSNATGDLLYGTHYGGGQGGFLYGIMPDGSGFYILHDFNPDAEAKYPLSLVPGSDGLIYGNALADIGEGVVFSVQPDGTGYTVLHDFDSAVPFFEKNQAAGLILASDGYLYGTTKDGGANGAGTVFKLNTDGTNYQKIYDFQFSSGANPEGGLIEANDGSLYGVTVNGSDHFNGAVYKIQTDGTGYAQLYSFNDINTGGNSGLLEEPDGNFKGLKYATGLNDAGYLYNIKSDGTSFSSVFDFGAADIAGLTPYAGLALASDAKLYGLANGIPASTGIVFGVTPGVEGFDPHSIDDPVNASLISKLVQGRDGFLYGTSWTGGSNQSGFLFKIMPDGSAYKNIHDFTGATGIFPNANPIEGFNGLFYGTCTKGGANSQGVIYSIKADGSAYTVLYSFPGIASGQSAAPLVQGPDGTLYGTSNISRPGTSGSLFRIGQDGSAFTIIHEFAPAEGTLLNAGMVLLNGVLYGTSSAGGQNNKGGIFKLKTDGSDFSLLHSFNGTDGENPYGGLTSYAGALFGITTYGGLNKLGVVYKINADGSGFSSILDLDAATGSHSFAPLAGICNPPQQPVITQPGTGVLMSSNPTGNQWYYNGKEITGSTQPTQPVFGVGIYSVRTTINDCVSLMSLNKEILITGLSSPKSDEIISVYPNPAKDKIYVTAINPERSRLSIEMFDLMGQPVLFSASNDETVLLDIAQLNSGSYILKISLNGLEHHRKFVKQ